MPSGLVPDVHFDFDTFIPRVRDGKIIVILEFQLPERIISA